LRISYSGIQHFFNKTLVRDWTIFNDIKWKREEKLPTILSLQEVKKIIYALPTQQSHTFYLTLYSMGLRLREATTLQVGDILSDRGLVHPHVFRHAYATHLLESNIPIRHVQKILGHKTLTSTMIYLHVTTLAEEDSNERVAQLMQGVLS
jgi:site-specific recombinase XerD